MSLLILLFVFGLVASLQDDCYYESSSSYMGHVNHTTSGLQCQRWDSQSPHRHIYNRGENFVDGVVPENYCRNILTENLEPWCYTTDPTKRWEYCSVTKCPGSYEDSSYERSEGSDSGSSHASSEGSDGGSSHASSEGSDGDSSESIAIPPISSITFTSTPTTIIPSFTKELDMRCELGELTDVEHVMSIGISRGDQRIASISDYHAAKADVDKIKVEGDANGTTGSYLSVEWSYPDKAQAGDYQCVIIVLYKDGFPGNFSASLEVESDPITLQDIVKVLIRQQEKITKQEEEIKKQEEDISELDHIEAGNVVCSPSSEWNETIKGWPDKYITKQFSRPFTSEPATFSSIRDWATYNHGPDTNSHRIGAYVSQVNTTHITVRCYKAYTDSPIFSFYVNWIAMAQ